MDVKSEQIRQAVRDRYGAVGAGTATGCCDPGCCTGNTDQDLGYSPEELAAAPEGANLGLGCGNPQAIASLRPGERVLDLGSGGGFDAFLAARQVGAAGRVIGVDMTPEMIARARANARKVDLANVEFRLGEIESLPVADAGVDVIMSNCVINLSTDKPAVLREAFRALAPGGRLAISDIVATAPIPDELRGDIEAHTGCIAGAALVTDLERWLAEAGFTDVRIDVAESSRALMDSWMPGRGAGRYVASALIQAAKPDSAAEPCCDTTLADRCCQPAEPAGA